MAPYSTVTATTTLTTTEEVPSLISGNDVINKNVYVNNKKEILDSSSQTTTANLRRSYKTLFGVFDTELKWMNIISITLFHCILIWGFCVFPYSQELLLVAYGAVVGVINAFGVTAGVHRLWCHRSYKAKLPLRIILMFCFSLAAQNSIYEWVRDHRVHHRYSETDADPHNVKRGFFFAHVGWLMMKKHPEVMRRGREVDMSDVLADPVVQFHQKHFLLLKLLCGFVIPTSIPPLLWGEDWYWSILGICVGRYVLALNFTWLVNSAAHLWGNKPYDKNISPCESLTVSVLAMGEGWHNYHHTFPWDYKASEFKAYNVNLTTFLIDIFAKIGWAYDLKQPSPGLVKNVIEKRGDGSHPVWGHEVTETGDLKYPNNDNNNLVKSD